MIFNCISAVLILLIIGCVEAVEEAPAVRDGLILGTYGNPRSFWESGKRLDDYHVNAIFVSYRLVNDALLARAEAENARVFAEFPTLNGKGYVEEHPEAWPINALGDQEPAADWFMGVCPTEPAFRQFRMDTARDLLRQYDIAGLWMDYVQWHAQFENPEPILPETCFNASCLEAFQAATGLTIPEGTTAERAQWILTHHDTAWRDWRASVVSDWARELKAIIRAERPSALLGVYHCPWTDAEHDGARRRILGIDFHGLAKHVDVFSPMVYHGRMRRLPGWGLSYTAWLCEALGVTPGRGPQVWPIVQGRSEPDHGIDISPEEFGQVLTDGLSGRSTGVMMFTIPGIVEEPGKLEMMQRVYGEWAAR